MTSDHNDVDTRRDRLLEALVSAATHALDDESGSRHSRSDTSESTQQVERRVHAELLFHARRLCPPGRRRSPFDETDDDNNAELDVIDLVQSAVDIARNQARKNAESTEAITSDAKKFKATATESAAALPPPPMLTSFSLLDQFNAKLLGGGMGLVTIEQILEAPTLADKLKLLHQVQSLDEEDWLPGTTTAAEDTGDWGHVLAVVRQGLAAPEPPSGGQGGAGVAMGYVKLLEKWIDMAGAAGGGSAFGGAGTIGVLQLDLVELAVDAMVVRANDLQLKGTPSDSLGDAVSSSPSANVRGILTALFRCFWTTWMDWMMNSESRIGAGNEDRVTAIGSKVWRASAPDGTQLGMLLSVLSALDPCGRWFSSWMSLRSGYPGMDVIDALVGACSGAGDGIGTSADGGAPLTRAWQHLARLEADLSSGKVDHLLVRCYWLSIIHSFLVRLRVSRFPWMTFTVNVPDDVNAAHATDTKDEGMMVSLVDLYLKVLSLLGSDGGIAGSQDATLTEGSWWKIPMQDICLDAIDSMLSGCRERDCYSEMIRSVRGAVAAADANPKLKALATAFSQQKPQD